MDRKPIDLKEGKYVIQVEAMKKSEDETSAMSPYLSNNTILTKLSSQFYVTLMLNEEQTITGLQIKNKHDEYTNSIDQHIDTASNTRYEIFQLDEFQTILNARVQYKVEHDGKTFEGDEELRLVFDAQSIQNVDDIDFE
ncbi:MAG TPA: NEAT domain-containing protein [Pseudogracilibacillus sp.]|nr:NEAT domain-containing protein [Pseudogracilibacillus sp.]